MGWQGAVKFISSFSITKFKTAVLSFQIAGAGERRTVHRDCKVIRCHGCEATDVEGPANESRMPHPTSSLAEGSKSVHLVFEADLVSFSASTCKRAVYDNRVETDLVSDDGVVIATLLEEILEKSVSSEGLFHLVLLSRGSNWAKHPGPICFVMLVEWKNEQDDYWTFARSDAAEFVAERRAIGFMEERNWSKIVADRRVVRKTVRLY
jgi:hypothetical protein